MNHDHIPMIQEPLNYLGLYEPRPRLAPMTEEPLIYPGFYEPRPHPAPMIQEPLELCYTK